MCMMFSKLLNERFVYRVKQINIYSPIVQFSLSTFSHDGSSSPQRSGLPLKSRNLYILSS